MRSRVIWRRSATAIGTYVAAGLGFFTTVVATRELGVHDYARFAAVIAATGFFQLLLDLTIEEALVKFGFRDVEARRWGRLRRLFEVAVGFKLVGGMLAALAVCALAPFADDIWGSGGVVVPMLIAALIPLAQAPENVAAGASSAYSIVFAAVIRCLAGSSIGRQKHDTTKSPSRAPMTSQSGRARASGSQPNRKPAATAQPTVTAMTMSEL